MIRHYNTFNYNELLTAPTFDIKDKTYTSLSFALDTETSSDVVNGQKLAWVYIWQVGLNNQAYYGRKLEELHTFLSSISDYLQQQGLYIFCWVQNMGYEFTFMSSIFNFTDIFAIGPNKPVDMYFGNIHFRDSLVFMNMSLEMIGKNHTRTKKLVGDLDYTRIRYPDYDDELTEKELAYCENDVIILNELWTYHIYPDYIKDKEKPYIPLTNTSKVRDYCRQQITNKKQHYRYMKSLFPTPEVYDALRMAFVGGYVHANYKNSNYWIIDEVYSYDLTSSYPASMLYGLYPMTPFKEVNPLDYNNYSGNEYAKLVLVELTNLKSKSSNRTLSHSKIINPEGAICDNGRLITMKKGSLWTTELDLHALSWFYDFKIKYLQLYTSKKGFLPPFLHHSLLHFYKQKSVLKGVAGKEKEYARSKNMLNSLFGMCCSSLTYPECNYNEELNEWTEQDTELDFSSNIFLSYAWGVWVAANSRFTLLKSVSEIGDDVVYCDTDSIKFKNKKNIKIFERENVRIRNAVKQSLELNNLTDYAPYIQGIGEWDLESIDESGNPTPYHRFKTMGAKKYCYNNKIVCSGINRKSLNAYAEMQGLEPWELFNDGLTIEGEYTGKTTMLYCFNSKPIAIQYTINGEERTLHTRNYVHASPAPFKISIHSDYRKVLEMAEELQIWKNRNIYDL